MSTKYEVERLRRELKRAKERLAYERAKDRQVSALGKRILALEKEQEPLLTQLDMLLGEISMHKDIAKRMQVQTENLRDVIAQLKAFKEDVVMERRVYDMEVKHESLERI